MKRGKCLILLFFFTCFAVPGFAQLSQEKLDSLVANYSRELRNKGIDSMLVYNEYCIGCLFHPVNGTNLCTENFSSLPTYIFWRDKGRTFATRKDICFDYSIQEIPNDDFWTFYFANREKIKTEKLKGPQYAELVNGKKQIRSIDVDHSIYFRLIITTGKEQLVKDINSFFFTKELGASGERNLNYEFNIRTSLSELHGKLQAIIKQEPLQRRFIRVPR